MSETRVTPQPPLSEYPVQVSPGRFELLDAVTIYNFRNQTNTDGRWLAVCKVKSMFRKRDGTPGEEDKVRIYRWRWRSATRWDGEKRVPTGEYRWFVEENHSIRQRKYWNATKEAVEKFLSEL